MTDTKHTGPVEVWLTQKNMTVTCRLVYDDESGGELEIDSVSMRGAQREVTSYLIAQEYKPEGRWTAEQSETEPGIYIDRPPEECWRRFKPVPA